MTSKVISVYENTQKLGAELAKNLSELANDVLAEGGNTVFKIGLSGIFKFIIKIVKKYCIILDNFRWVRRITIV